MSTVAPSPAVVNAWRTYLEQTLGLSTDAYERVEPFAWQTLQSRLERLRKRGR